jgi:hypothetical protein
VPAHPAHPLIALVQPLLVQLRFIGTKSVRCDVSLLHHRKPPITSLNASSALWQSSGRTAWSQDETCGSKGGEQDWAMAAANDRQRRTRSSQSAIGALVGMTSSLSSMRTSSPSSPLDRFSMSLRLLILGATGATGSRALLAAVFSFGRSSPSLPPTVDSSKLLHTSLDFEKLLKQGSTHEEAKKLADLQADVVLITLFNAGSAQAYDIAIASCGKG